MRSGDGVTDIVVVISPPGASGIREVVREWSSAGFVRPFLWWESETGDGRFTASRSDGSEESPLLDLLAEQPYSGIRLVALLPLALGAADGFGDLPALSERIRDVVARRKAPEQKLSSFGVIVAASGVSDVPRSVLSSRWDVNVVAVDEDGLDPRHASREIRGADELAAHAALALVSVSGLWVGMAETPFDQGDNGTGDQEPRVRLVRCYARAARSFGLPDQILGATLGRHRNGDWAAELVGADLVADPGPQVERVTREYLDGPGRGLRRTPCPRRRVRRFRVTPRLALQMLWLFLRGRVAEIPGELVTGAVNHVYDRLENVTKNVTFGDGSEFVVKFDGRALGAEQDDQEPDEVNLAQALVEAVERPSAPRRFSDEWQSLRELSFGLVDAGELPEGCTAPVSGTRRLVMRPDAISPGPHDGDESAEAWLAADPHSVLSRIGRRVQADLTETGTAFVAAVARLKRAQQRPPAVSVDRKLWIIWLLICCAGAVGVTAAVVLGLTETISQSDAFWYGGAILVLFLGASATVAFLHLRKEFQAAHQRNSVWAEYEDALRTAEHEAEELIRLTAAWKEYKDWAPMIGRVVHQIDRETVAVPDDCVDLGNLSRPWSFGVAATETNPVLLDRLAAIIGGRCFRRGWLAGLYKRAEEHAMTAVKFGRGLPAASANPDPDIDASARRTLDTDLRTGLTGRVLLGDLRLIVAEEMFSLGLTELYSAALPPAAEPLPVIDFLRVLCAEQGEHGDGLFNRRLWTAASGFPRVNTEPVVWLPDLVEPVGNDSRRLVVELDAGSPVVAVLSVRVDMTPPVPWSQLVLFDGGKDVAERPSTPEYEDGDVG